MAKAKTTRAGATKRYGDRNRWGFIRNLLSTLGKRARGKTWERLCSGSLGGADILPRCQRTCLASCVAASSADVRPPRISGGARETALGTLGSTPVSAGLITTGASASRLRSRIVRSLMPADGVVLSGTASAAVKAAVFFGV